MKSMNPFSGQKPLMLVGIIILGIALITIRFLLNPTAIETNSPATINTGLSEEQSILPSESRIVSLKERVQDAAATKGNPNAPIIIIEYLDFQCPFSRKFYAETEQQLIRAFVETGSVLFAIKDYPLQSRHSNAFKASEAARCAGDQNAYWKMHDKIFDEQNKKGGATIDFSVEDLKQWAYELELDMETFKDCLDSNQHHREVIANKQDGIRADIAGTPGFLIGKAHEEGKILIGTKPFARFQKIIRELEKDL